MSNVVCLYLGKKTWIWLPNVACVVYLVIQCTHKSLSGNHKPPPGLTAIVVKSIGLITSQKKALIRMLFLWSSFLEDIYSINRLLYWKYQIDFELLLNIILSFYRDIIKETTSKTMSLLKIFWIFITITLLCTKGECSPTHLIKPHPFRVGLLYHPFKPITQPYLYKCYMSMGFIPIWMGPTVEFNLISYKIFKFEGYK